jgi:hypothetical protein
MLVVAASMFLFAQALPRGLDQFLSSQRWQLLIELAQPLTESELTPLLQQPGIALWEGIRVVPATIGPVRPLPPGGLGMVYGRYLQTENEPEAVINLRLAQSLGLTVGDELAVTIDASGEAGAVVPTADEALPRGSGRLRIVGICTNYAINQVFVSLHTLSQLQPGPLRYAAVVTAPQLPPAPGSPGATPPLSRDLDLEARLRALPQVARVVPWQPIASISLLGCDALVGFVRLYGNLGGAVALFLIFTVICACRERSWLPGFFRDG